MKIMINAKKTSIIVVIILSILFITITPILLVKNRAYAINELYDMSTDECVTFIKNNRISIPNGLEESGQLGLFVKSVIDNVIVDRNYQFAYNFDKTLQFAEEIKALILKKHPIEQYTVSRGITTNYKLQNSFVKNDINEWVTSGGAWNNLWNNFNCYAYSINKWRTKNSEKEKTYQPGQFSSERRFSYQMSVNELSDIIKQDLEALGMKNILLSTTIPTVNSNQKLICVRIGGNDYHLMKYDAQTSSWYHKPGKSSVLKYKHTPTNSIMWTNESSFEGLEYASNCTYHSPIIFIRYDNYYQTLSNTNIVKFNTNLPSNKDFLQEIKATITDTYNFKFLANEPIKIWLYDETMTFIKEYSGTLVNINEILNYGVYHIGMESSFPESISVSTTVHVHNYKDHECMYCDYYSTTAHDFSYKSKWVNTKQHKSICFCEEYVLRPHVISKSNYNVSLSSYSICIVCNGKAELGQIMQGVNSLSIISMSQNGSFILSNGVIVLDNADYNAYFNNTLKFNNNNLIA